MKGLILTGPKGSGKTTLLQHWLEENEAGGILSPVEECKRVFASVTSGMAWQMEAGKDESEVLNVGKYSFSKKGFEQAEATLLFDLRAGNLPLVIDEIGPLELRESGLHHCLKKILSSKKTTCVIAVVREGLVKEVIKAYFEEAEEVVVATREDFNEKARLFKRASQ